MVSRLDAGHPELAEALTAIPTSLRARRVAKAARLAADRCEVDIAGLSDAQLAQLVDQLDESAWAVKDGDAAAYDRYFRKARAVAAVRYSLDTDDGVLAESVYEACHAIGPEDVGDALITDE